MIQIIFHNIGIQFQLTQIKVSYIMWEKEFEQNA